MERQLDVREPMDLADGPNIWRCRPILVLYNEMTQVLQTGQAGQRGAWRHQVHQLELGKGAERRQGRQGKSEEDSDEVKTSYKKRNHWDKGL